MKTCSKCKKDKESDCFRPRFDKRNGRHYLNPSCKECDAAESRAYYAKVKDIEEFKFKNRSRVKKYHIENTDIVREKQQARRQTERHRNNRKVYIIKNKEKIHAQEKICKRKYHEKHRDNLTDEYILSRLVQKSPLSKNEIPKSLIKLKRLEIICKRTLKTIKP